MTIIIPDLIFIIILLLPTASLESNADKNSITRSIIARMKTRPCDTVFRMRIRAGLLGEYLFQVIAQ